METDIFKIGVIMELTKNNIGKVLNAYRESNEDEFRELVEGYGDTVELEGVKFEVEDEFGGEGKGDHMHTVLKVTKNDNTAYIKFDAYYSSYDGGDFGDYDFDLVEPYEKTVRDWKKVK